MKIELEFTKFQVHFISTQLDMFENGMAKMNFRIQPSDKKLVLSICSDIADKFHNKIRSINKELKPRKKPYKFTLKWHQAYALNKLMFAATLNAANTEDCGIGGNIQMIIGQKLA